MEIIMDLRSRINIMQINSVRQQVYKSEFGIGVVIKRYQWKGLLYNLPQKKWRNKYIVKMDFICISKIKSK